MYIITLAFNDHKAITVPFYKHDHKPLQDNISSSNSNKWQWKRTINLSPSPSLWLK